MSDDFDYHVIWSPDSRWVAIEGGAHKFFAWVVYRLDGDRAVRCTIPEAQLMAGAVRKPVRLVRRTIALASDDAFVAATSPGVFAVHSHPYVCCDGGEDIHGYVLVDFREGTAGRIVGTAKE